MKVQFASARAHTNYGWDGKFYTGFVDGLTGYDVNMVSVFTGHAVCSTTSRGSCESLGALSCRQDSDRVLRCRHTQRLGDEPAFGIPMPPEAARHLRTLPTTPIITTTQSFGVCSAMPQVHRTWTCLLPHPRRGH